MYRILVVDDEPEILEVLRRRLRSADREVVVTDSPRDALKLLAREAWDVLITDVKMPEVDGFQLVREASRVAAGVTCIAITGYGTDSTLESALKTDCFGYLHKPFDWNYLGRLVDKAIRSSDRLRSGSVWHHSSSSESTSAGGCV